MMRPASEAAGRPAQLEQQRAPGQRLLHGVDGARVEHVARGEAGGESLRFWSERVVGPLVAARVPEPLRLGWLVAKVMAALAPSAECFDRGAAIEGFQRSGRTTEGPEGQGF